jgi:hypothetical protein
MKNRWIKLVDKEPETLEQDVLVYTASGEFRVACRVEDNWMTPGLVLLRAGSVTHWNLWNRRKPIRRLRFRILSTSSMRNDTTKATRSPALMAGQVARRLCRRRQRLLEARAPRRLRQ